MTDGSRVLAEPRIPGVERWRSHPHLAVEGAVLDGFGNVRHADLLRAGQIGDRAVDLEDAVACLRWRRLSRR